MEELAKKVEASIQRFTGWLDAFGETSQDYQDFFASGWAGKAKSYYYKKPILGKVAVAPMILCEAFFPSTRKFFWHKRRFPIADAHYAMGFAFLYRITKANAHYERAIHFLEELYKSRCADYKELCWGYPFNWVTRNGTMPQCTPLITTTPYAYEAFLDAYEIDGNPRWLDTMRSIAEHAYLDILDYRYSPDATTCSYSPKGEGGVVNASAYRAFLLTSASELFAEEKYRQKAESNLRFVLQSQRADGSWYYAIDGVRGFIDHFHTCFVLKALAKIERLTRNDDCRKAIRNGVDYYRKNLFFGNGLPKPFSRPPRLTIYQQELYDYAECVNLCVLLKEQFPELTGTLKTVVSNLLEEWQTKDGSFRSRRLLIGWDNVPMHRWAQSQLFRSLCFFLSCEYRKRPPSQVA